MSDKIELPKITIQKGAKAHLFPIQIAYQTQEFLHGAIFYFTISDESSGIFFHIPNSINILESSLKRKGMKKPEWDLGWNIIQQYKNMFENMVFKNVLITIRSYWDWYINQLSKFIIFAQENIGNPLQTKEYKQLTRITYKEIVEQVEIIERICRLDFNLSQEIKQKIKEMSLVRNLGLHNRWEVDQQYISKTIAKNDLKIGYIRNFTAEELHAWHKVLIKLLHDTSIPIANKYLNVHKYP